MATLEDEMGEITSFVDRYRAKYNVVPANKEPLELSGEAFGEGHVTLYQSLIPATPAYGAWSSLNDAAVRQLVLDQVRRDRYVLDQ